MGLGASELCAARMLLNPKPMGKNLAENPRAIIVKQDGFTTHSPRLRAQQKEQRAVPKVSSEHLVDVLLADGVLSVGVATVRDMPGET